MEDNLMVLLFLFYQLNQTQLLIPLPQHKLCNLQFHEHRLVLVLKFNFEAFFLHHLLYGHYFAVAFKQEETHDIVLAKPKQCKF